MARKKNAQEEYVQDAHISQHLNVLHGALMSIVSAMNRPQRDADMIKRAGIRLDRALFPLLVGIERLGPIGVVEIADRLGRDYTTVSRQVAKLDSLGLVTRHASATDGRVRVASITPEGKVMTDAVDQARAKVAREIFESWEVQDFESLVRLTRRFADALEEGASAPR